MIECRCRHENDRAVTVIVASPHLKTISECCNADPTKYLCKQSVDADLLLKQHDNLVSELRQHGVCVLDVMDYMKVAADQPYPELGNLVFMRDPLLCTNRGLILGKFKEAVRRGETELLANMLPSMGISILNSIEGKGAFIEGGDFLPAGETCFVGVGNRTNMEGVLEMLNHDLFGTEKVVVVCHPQDGNMHSIHLDCYMGLVGMRVAVVWETAAAFDLVKEYVWDGDTRRYILQQNSVPLGEYLEAHGWNVITVPTSSQQAYGCNLLYLGENKVMTQDAYVTAKLSELGFDAIQLDVRELHKMYGGIRCATQVLVRI